MPKIRVLVADDHAVLRAGLRLLIDAQSDTEVAGEASNGRETLFKVRELDPDVLTLDLTMPGLSGAPLIERLRQEFPRTKILVLTMHDDPTYLSTALAAGANGYVVKTAADSELLSAIRAIYAGRTFVDLNLSASQIPGTLASKFFAHGPAAGQRSSHTLTRRERDVLQFLAQGYTNQQIASKLHVSIKTVESHRKHIIGKLGLRDRADFTRYALDVGLLHPSYGAGKDNGTKNQS